MWTLSPAISGAKPLHAYYIICEGVGVNAKLFRSSRGKALFITIQSTGDWLSDNYEAFIGIHGLWRNVRQDEDLRPQFRSFVRALYTLLLKLSSMPLLPYRKREVQLLLPLSTRPIGRPAGVLIDHAKPLGEMNPCFNSGDQL